MKVTFNWLKQYVDFSWSTEELSERLTMMGIEVEGIQKLSGEFEGVVVAQILASDKHPNADKLSVCRVADGRSERQIVCGAKNYQVGDKVPLALPGCTLPTPAGTPPFTIKISKMRGVESQGMLCSAKELGIAEDAEGLLILPADAKVGQSFAEHLGRSAGDVVFDLEITPNRPDLNSVIGIAREISALTGHPLKLPVIQFLNTSSEPITGVVNVRVEDPDLCPRYNARVVRGVKVGTSPDWLKQMLEKVGLRSINNVVDVTNYVLYEAGQPLHAFDYHLLAAASGTVPTIVVRRAHEGEKFTTLDGIERTLTANALLIADETKAVALAGIMGGRNSEIHDSTVDVLIESACFKPQNIRATSKRLDLRTDASYRFERGCDIGICDWASRRAAQLISEVAGGTILGHHVDAYPHPAAQREILLRPTRTNALLGIAIERTKQITLLRQLGLDILHEAEASASLPTEDLPIRARVPSFRVDLKSEIDLIEEIARLYGIERIPASAPRSAIGSHPFDKVYDQLMEVRKNLVSLGLFEAQGQTLISDMTLAAREADATQAIRLENPLSSDMNVLRPSLIPGLLDALRHNLHHKNLRVPLFEIGRVFTSAQSHVTEGHRMAIAVSGNRELTYWAGSDRETKFDVFDLKGILEEFFENLGSRGISFVRRPEPTHLLLESASITLGKTSIGEIGQLLPALARRLDLRDPVFVTELFLPPHNPGARSFKVLPSFPSIRRDIAMLVPEQITHETVLHTVKQAKPQNLEAIELFDVFRGKNIPEGQKSVAYAFIYRSAEKTLTDAEVNAAHEKVIAHLKQTLHAAVRDH